MMSGLRILAWLAAAVLSAVLVPVSSAQSQTRVALVIGNSTYGYVEALPNPERDADAVAQALERLNFDVVLKKDLSKSALEEALADFSDKATGSDSAVFYYAGHGMEMNGENYLIPIDAKLKSDNRIKFETVSLNDILSSIEGVRGLKLVLLDACRNNPFSPGMKRSLATRSISRGLATVEARPGILVSYAAAAGTTADDGEGEHSPYTEALLKHMEQPGLEVSLMFRQIADYVQEKTGGRQTPFEYGRLPGVNIYLSPPLEGQDSGTSNIVTPPADPCRDAAIHWSAIRDENNAALYEEHITRFGNCAFGTLAGLALERLNAAPSLTEDVPQKSAVKTSSEVASIDPDDSQPTLEEDAAVNPNEAFDRSKKASICFVYVGSRTDKGWSQSHDEGRLELEKEFGDMVDTKFVENVPEGPDAEPVIERLARSGCNMIFTTSFGFMEATLKVAEKFPDVKFEHATGFKTASNVATYNARFYEGRYIAGQNAARVSKTGVAGYIGSFPIPEVVQGINAFVIGARSVNPAFKVKVAWISSWFDPAKEADAAKMLINQGADVLTQHTDTTEPMRVAAENGIHAVGQAFDMIATGPEAQLTSITNTWGHYYAKRVRLFLDGKWQTTSSWDGLKDGILTMAPYTNMPEDAKLMAEATEAQIKSGALDPFTGPLNKQDGTTWLKAGESPDDGTLLSMNFYVEGVDDTLP